MLFQWIIYLFMSFIFTGSLHVLAIPNDGGLEGQIGPATSKIVKRSLLTSLLHWSAAPEETQGVLGEYTETDYVQESSEMPRDVQEQTFKYEIYESTTEQLTSKTWNESIGSTGVDLLVSVGTADTPTKSWEWTSPATKQDHILESGVTTASREDTTSDFQNTTTAPCRSSNDTDDSPQPPDPLHLSLPLSLSLFVPLYSDWNSALATWGLAWEAHIYGLASVFSAVGLVSFISIFALPLRCPPGILYFALLHFFLLSFTGAQAFVLIYDAYSFQDRLPPLALLPISALPYPCLIFAFSTTFILLSLRSNLQISLPLAISPSFSALPKPCFLVSMSVLHFGLSLGCVGILELFPKLPTIILLIPQGIFVCLSIFLSCSYFVFYCLVQVDSKHIYRLNDSGESGGSPEVIRPPRCPFAQMEDWRRAVRSGLAASIFLLSCGGFQLYAILHSLGYGGFDDIGFYPWPWWGFQLGCRIGEIGVCLGLALIGTRPIFCRTSTKTVIKPQMGSWSRLSPTRELELASEEGVLSSQNKMQNIGKEKSDTLPLCPIDPPGNGVECAQKSNQIVEQPLHTKQSPTSKPKNATEMNPTSLNKLDSTVDLRPPSPINLSRSIDQALYSESLFSHSIFEWPRLFQTSSNLSLNRQEKSGLVENGLYRTASCKDMEQNTQAINNQLPKRTEWKGSINESTQELCRKPKEVGKVRSHSWANRGHNFAQSSLPRAIPHLSHYKRFRTLSTASQDSKGSVRLAGTKQLSESKQLEWDMAVQAEFVNVCKQIDALSVCSDTIDL
ncbi:proline-rich transmembrane protein 4 [Periophthalmus magnuspinnatus]|uniref:proline-rich transmembrane protein 4 n=1 Tax=Periophthalmus magnuspinnatus TaxID=409849 RepID=UPI0024365DF3|nr:proline-rich transmembrane protein 4 [Periophthalmus magnuspinnatus]